MIRFDYDPRVVEQATFLAVRTRMDWECALHERLDPLYRIADAEVRQRAFREAYGEMFRRFKLDRIVPAPVPSYRHISQSLSRCLIREAERARAQNVDLYQDHSSARASYSSRILIITICPEILLQPARLTPWLIRQLQHIEDMLDDEFAYDRTLPAVGMAEQNLIRDRYAVLWDIYVEGRLIRAGRIDRSGVERLWFTFGKTFTHQGRAPSRETFDRLLNADSLKHDCLLAWSVKPWGGVWGERGGM